ncbi:hypothetical protein [Janthinobacterium sp. 35]|uniref:hypothetical protein n=1 Tax=Janthinobacterium sp. 35 TaxID=2035210 RepID=UPI000C1793FE|nr:hypothetical protein [Janthinobacterium sp. 35]
MGKVSRDARLLFILTWTLADDEGRLRGSSRMLASLLFPYDDDAPSLIDGWIAELVAEGCVYVYSVEGSTYMQIAKWLNHQKIDKPSKSKIPEFVEPSRNVANARGGIKDQGSKDQGSEERIEGQENTTVEQTQLDAVKTIFAFWQKVMDSPRSVLDDKRKRVITKALKGYTPADICKAIRGCSKTPHNMGQNAQKTKYNGLDLILRDADHIDRFIRNDAGQARANACSESIEDTNARVMRELMGGGSTVGEIIDMVHA